MRDEFRVYRLNAAGMEKAVLLASLFECLLNDVENICGVDGREIAVVRTKLQEAAFFAKRAMGMRPEHRE